MLPGFVLQLETPRGGQHEHGSAGELLRDGRDAEGRLRPNRHAELQAGQPGTAVNNELAAPHHADGGSGTAVEPVQQAFHPAGERQLCQAGHGSLRHSSACCVKGCPLPFGPKPRSQASKACGMT